MNIGFEEHCQVTEEAVAAMVTHWVGENGQLMCAMSPQLSAGLAMFAEEDLQGFAIVDSGATRSMSGTSLFDFAREAIFECHGDDLTEIDYDDKARFSYANNTKGTSVGAGGIPHPLGLEAKDGKLWFSLVATDSPMLLGLDYLREAKADVTHDGYLQFADGHREKLQPLRSGHWGLQIL